MSGRNGKKTTIGGQFAPRLIEMLESPAHRVLSLSAHRVLARIEIELGHHGGNDNGKLPVTFDQFEEYGLHRHAIAPAVRECVALGFVEIMQQGRAGNAEWRRPTLYRLTYRHTDKSGATNDWQRIASSKEASGVATKARSEKQNSSGGKRQFSVRKPHHKPKILSAETTTTSVSAETTTTSISREATPFSPPSARPTKRPAREGGPAADHNDHVAVGAAVIAAFPSLCKKMAASK